MFKINLKAMAAAQGGSKQAAARQFEIDTKRVRIGGVPQPVLAPRRRRVLNCLVDVVAADNAKEGDHC